MFPVSPPIFFRPGQEPGIELSTDGSRAGAIRGFALGVGWPRLSLRDSCEQVYLFLGNCSVSGNMFLSLAGLQHCSCPRRVCSWDSLRHYGVG